jgi:hypothetical protein
MDRDKRDPKKLTYCGQYVFFNALLSQAERRS